MFGYDTVRQFERLPTTTAPGPDVPDLHLVETGTFLLFDRLRQTVRVVSVAAPGEDGEEDPAESWRIASDRVAALAAALRGPSPGLSALDSGAAPAFRSNTDDERFRSVVETAREYIRSGDIIQVVLSQRFEADRGDLDPARLYRALRRVNPSPYLFFLRLGADRALLGASPETLVRVEDGVAEVRPIAGTRPRGGDPAEDQRNANDLLSDPKERAEHLMLLDLGRNDLGRISQTGTVEVVQSFEVERYSHVMHLVSTVRGRVRPEVDALDVLRATFPAGTLSGAPKVRAMEIIEELEPVGRGPYGGAVGYLGWDGGLDLCICIRSMLALEDRLYVQAGAGIVYDSDPETERRETLHKAQALFTALDEVLA
jgi:anthranilate synthase component 1